MSFCSLLSSSENIFSVIDSLRFGSAEKERLLSISSPSARLESLSALLALDSLCPLSGELAIARASSGKPYFSSNPLFFSLSHADGLGVAALSDTLVGIDLEWTDKKRNFSAISKRFFTPDEQDRLSSAEDTVLEFFSIWTKKEAFAKLTGEGFLSTCSLNDFCGKRFKQYILRSNGRQAAMSICYDSDKDQEITFHNVSKEIEIYEL